MVLKNLSKVTNDMVLIYNYSANSGILSVNQGLPANTGGRLMNDDFVLITGFISSDNRDNQLQTLCQRVRGFVC